MKKERINTTVDLALLILFLMASAILMVELYIGNYFSVGFLIFIIIVLIALLVLYFVWILNTYKLRWLRRLSLIMISFGLFSFTAFINYTRSTVAQIETSNINNYRITLVSLNQTTTMSDLEETQIGYLSKDKLRINELEKTLKKDLKTFELVEYNNFDSLGTDLVSNQISAALLSDDSKDLMTAFVKNVKAAKTIHQYLVPIKMNETATIKDMLSEPFTVFISASDSLDVASVVGKSDVNILVMVNPSKKKISMISLPPNAYLPNPAYDYYPDQLSNTASNGIDNTIFALESVVGFDINYYVRFNYNSLINLVDQVNGIEVEVVEEFCEMDENNRQAKICLTKGKNVLKGSEALAYARHIGNHNQASRLINQQNIIKAILNKASKVVSPNSLLSVVSTISKTASMNIETTNLRNFITSFVSQMSEWEIEMSQIDRGVLLDAPCVSWNLNDKKNVYVLSEADLAHIYETYLETSHSHELSAFSFSLNQMKDGRIIPAYNENLVTSNNARRKIAEYFILQPNSTINPVEIESWKQEGTIENPQFDPNSDVYDVPGK